MPSESRKVASTPPHGCFVGAWANDRIADLIRPVVSEELQGADGGSVSTTKGHARYTFSAQSPQAGKYAIFAHEVAVGIEFRGQTLTARVQGEVQGTYAVLAPNRIATSPAVVNGFQILLEGLAPIVFPGEHWQDTFRVECGTQRQAIRLESESRPGLHIEARRIK